MQCALFLYSLIHSITRHFTERVNCKLKRKRKLLRWDLRTEYTLILYLSCNWVRVTVPFVLPLKLCLGLPTEPFNVACQRGIFYYWGGVPCSCAARHLSDTKGIGSATACSVILEFGQDSTQSPRPYLSSQLSTQAFHWTPVYLFLPLSSVLEVFHICPLK